MADDKGDQGGEGGGGERPPLRRRRAPSVVPEEGLGEETGERRRRLLSEPATPAASAAPIKARRWWFRARSEPVPASDLAETEARAAAAKSAAAELRSRLKTEGTPPPPGEEPAADEPAPPTIPPGAAEAATAAGAAAAAAAPAPPRRRRRRTTELVAPPLWQRHDLLVVAVAVLLFAGGAAGHRILAAPTLVPIDELGLRVARPKNWLAPVRVGPPASGLAAGVDAGRDEPRPGRVLRHVVYQSAVAATARLEIRIAERPASATLKSALVLGRVSRYGESFTPAESTDRTIGGRDWVRTQYRYPYKSSPSDAPVIATAIEYATLNGRLMYVVTVHGDEKTARRLEALLVPTLKVDPNHPAAVGRGGK